MSGPNINWSPYYKWNTGEVAGTHIYFNRNFIVLNVITDLIMHMKIMNIDKFYI